jgi:hypothetical protein
MKYKIGDGVKFKNEHKNLDYKAKIINIMFHCDGGYYVSNGYYTILYSKSFNNIDIEYFDSVTELDIKYLRKQKINKLNEKL